MDRGAWWAAVHKVAQSWARLKRLSMDQGSVLAWGLGVSAHGYPIVHALLLKR